MQYCNMTSLDEDKGEHLRSSVGPLSSSRHCSRPTAGACSLPADALSGASGRACLLAASVPPAGDDSCLAFLSEDGEGDDRKPFLIV